MRNHMVKPTHGILICEGAVPVASTRFSQDGISDAQHSKCPSPASTTGTKASLA
jgi:hypothetical protein